MSQSNEVSRLEARALGLEDRLFQVSSRYLVLFITFNYKPECWDVMCFDDIKLHRDRLLNRQRTNSLLKGIKGYVWKIEKGAISGLHMHMLVFYDGKKRSDVLIGQALGDLWVDVTYGAGAYRSSNGDKAEILARGLDLGIGQVDRQHDGSRRAIRTIIHYMAKGGQEIEDRPEHARTFGMSEVPR